MAWQCPISKVLMIIVYDWRETYFSDVDVFEMLTTARYCNHRPNTELASQQIINQAITTDAFIIKNPIELDLSDKIDPVRWKECVSQIYHRDTHYYVTISHNTSVPMIGHLEMAIGMLTTCASWAWLKKSAMKSDFSQIRPSRDRFDYECGSDFWLWM